MKYPRLIAILLVMLVMTSCHSPQREARRMVKRAEQLFDTCPDSAVILIDSVLRMPVNFNEKQRMDMALLQGKALFGDRGQEIPPLMDDEFFDDKPFLTTSPELERAADYYARKKEYAEAAHAALYSGFVQQHYGEKQAAVHSFKDAERYGGMAKDSLAVAQAQYWMGKKFLDDGMTEEALGLLKSAEYGFGSHLIEKALTQNVMGVCYVVQREYDNAENCLRQSLTLAKNNHFTKAKHRALNNYAVLYRVQGKHDLALDCLKTIEDELDSGNKELLILYLNKGNVFADMKRMDSASFYYQIIADALPEAKIKDETKVAAYGALSRYAQHENQMELALQYCQKHEGFLYKVMQRRQEQTIYRIQHQYDYESLQNKMNRKLIRRQRLVSVIGVLFILGLVALAFSQIRLAKIRRQEAEAKGKLFHFMQQNKELALKHEEYAKLHTELMHKQNENEKVYQELAQESEEYKQAYQNYAEMFSNAKEKELRVVLKLSVFLKNKGNAACLDDLKRIVFNVQTPWEAIFNIFDTLYPDVRENLKRKHPELSEMEQKDFILSFFGVSRHDEADMLETTIYTVDKLRNSVRKKMRNTTDVRNY